MTESVRPRNSKLKSSTFKSCFAPFWLVPARATKSFVVDWLFFVFKDFKSTASDLLDLIFVFADCDVWKELFYVNGSALVLLVRSAFSWLWSTAISTSTRAATLGRSSPTRGRRFGCCWNVEVGFWVESFDADGGALVLLERCPADCGCGPGAALPGGTGRSLRLRDQYPMGPGRSPRCETQPRAERGASRGGAGLCHLARGPVVARNPLFLHEIRA